MDLIGKRFKTKASNEFKAIDTVNKKEYLSNNITQFAKEHNLQSSSICLCLNGKRNTHKGFIFKKI